MPIVMMTCTRILLNEIGHDIFHQRDIAKTYRLAMLSGEPADLAHVASKIFGRQATDQRNPE
jgi:hypothetical protein